MIVSMLERVSRLFALYCWYYDSNDVEGIGSIFADQIQVDYGPEFPTVTSRMELMQKISEANSSRFLVTSHHVSNVVVLEEDESRVNGQSYLYAWHRYRDGSPDSELWGRYHATFIKDQSDLKFHTLVLRAAGSLNFHRTRMTPIERFQ
jgi:hypothetical protein